MRRDVYKPKDVLLYSISIAIIGIAISIAYYFFIYIPKRDRELKGEQARAELQKTLSETAKKGQLSECIYQAELNNEERWNAHCEKLGKEESCLLPLVTAESYREELENEKELCFRKYE